jgi:predicted DNA-binding transcriptional regulator YafY
MSKNTTSNPVKPKSSMQKAGNAETSGNQQKTSGATLMRQWRLYQTLPKGPPGVTVTELLAELQEHFQVERRTIERDLEMLSLVLQVGCNDKGKPFGWYRTESDKRPPMSLPEALLLHLAEPELSNLLPGMLRPLLAAGLAEAAEQLQENAKSKRWQLNEKLAFVPTPQLQQAPVIDAEVLSTVQSALMEDFCVEIDYQSPYRLPTAAATENAATESAAKQAIKTTSKYLLHPLALIQNGMQLYLVAIVDGYSDTRLFAMQRISAAQVTKKPAERPADFKLQPYLSSGALQFVSEPAPFTLCARVDTTLANLLAEAPLGTQMHLEQAVEPGWWQLTTSISDSWNLRLWLQSQGSRVEVLSPLWLRQQLQAELQRTLALYQR